VATIESVLHETRLFAPNDSFVSQANLLNEEACQALCREAEKDYLGFWGKLAQEHIQWHKPFTRVLDESNYPFFKWFDDGELNVSKLHKTMTKHKNTLFDAGTAPVGRVSISEYYRDLSRRFDAETAK